MSQILSGKRFKLKNDPRFDHGELPEITKIKAHKIKRGLMTNLKVQIKD